MTGPTTWETPEDLVRDDDWSCPSENSRELQALDSLSGINKLIDMIYVDHRNPNPRHRRAPASEFEAEVTALWEAEDEVYKSIPVDERISEYSMETIPAVYTIKPVQTAEQAARFEREHDERCREWLTKPKFLTGIVQQYPGKYFSTN
jgi:hypothetical protein